MNHEHFIISQYESMCRVTSEMLAAARRNDWDGVVDAERDCARIVETLKKLNDLVPSDPDLRRRKSELIRKVLADDKEIRYLAQPSLHKLENSLKSSGTSKKLGYAYGLGGVGADEGGK